MSVASTLESLVVITGMSGSGKHTAFKALEDLGYFCVDNLPPDLVPRLVQMAEASEGRIAYLAMGVDVRSGGSAEAFEELIGQLRMLPVHTTVIFVNASDEVLARRYSETRRVHPLAHHRSLLDGVKAERQQMLAVKELSDLVVDTSEFSVHDLRRYIQEKFSAPSRKGDLVVSLLSFGFKHGLPTNADLVFDVRFLPNPYFVQELRPLSGLDLPVSDFLSQDPETEESRQRFLGILEFLLPRYRREGKSYLTIAIGCTGGRHRSVFLSERLRDGLQALDYSVTVTHRDVVRHG